MKSVWISLSMEIGHPSKASPYVHCLPILRAIRPLKQSKSCFLIFFEFHQKSWPNFRLTMQKLQLFHTSRCSQGSSQKMLQCVHLTGEHLMLCAFTGWCQASSTYKQIKWTQIWIMDVVMFDCSNLKSTSCSQNLDVSQDLLEQGLAIVLWRCLFCSQNVSSCLSSNSFLTDLDFLDGDCNSKSKLQGYTIETQHIWDTGREAHSLLA